MGKRMCVMQIDFPFKSVFRLSSIINDYSMIIHCVMLSKNVCMMTANAGKATCVKADTLGLPSDHMLNYAVFDVVVEVVYLLIKTKHFGPYICTSAYILYHSRANNYINNSGKWQKLHIWKTHFWTMISTVINGSQ